jgi:quinol monooxygenase YgiN
MEQSSVDETYSICQLLAIGCHLPALSGRQQGRSMYGLIGKIIAVEGSRDSLAAILLDGIAGMPGCLSYVVARDTEDPNALWVTEVWDSESSHENSLSLPSVREAIQKGRPMIAGFGERYITNPLGGQGLGQS